MHSLACEVLTLLSVLASRDEQESQEPRCQESQESRGMPELLDEWESELQELRGVPESLDEQESESQELRGVPESLDERELQEPRCQESESQESRGVPESLDEWESQVQGPVGNRTLEQADLVAAVVSLG